MKLVDAGEIRDRIKGIIEKADDKKQPSDDKKKPPIDLKIGRIAHPYCPTFKDGWYAMTIEEWERGKKRSDFDRSDWPNVLGSAARTSAKRTRPEPQNIFDLKKYFSAKYVIVLMKDQVIKHAFYGEDIRITPSSHKMTADELTNFYGYSGLGITQRTTWHDVVGWQVGWYVVLLYDVNDIIPIKDVIAESSYDSAIMTIKNKKYESAAKIIVYARNGKLDRFFYSDDPKIQRHIRWIGNVLPDPSRNSGRNVAATTGWYVVPLSEWLSGRFKELKNPYYHYKDVNNRSSITKNVIMFVESNKIVGAVPAGHPDDLWLHWWPWWDRPRDVGDDY